MKKNEDGRYYVIGGKNTGIYRREAFLQEVERLLEELENPQDYSMLAIDIEYFKLFNEWYGLETGDRFLKGIAEILSIMQTKCYGTAGYIFGDDFAVFAPFDEESVQRLYDSLLTLMKSFDANGSFFPMIGVYQLPEGERLPASILYDRACFAQAEARGNLVKRIFWYKKSLQDKLVEEQHLIHSLQQALQEGDITYYLQPKCDIRNGRIVGAEALVRWIDSGKNIISPGIFIPVLEKTGLICKVDVYVWEAVCRDIRKWIDQGKTPLPVSVNLSRKDIYIIDAAQVLKSLIEKYRLDPKLLEIEITESAYAENDSKTEQLLNNLRTAGFRTSMDDFGSGYSSLNMLKDVNVDLLKIDMYFLKMDEHSYVKGVGIIETIINMARVLEIPVIAEGVEDENQVHMLREIGCTYVQGYYFYRPMPVEDFYRLIEDENRMDSNGIMAACGDYVSLKELLNNQLLSSSMLDRMLGAFAFIECDGESLYRVKANEEYYEIVNLKSLEDISAMRKKNLREFVHPADWSGLMQAFTEIYKEPLSSRKTIYRGKYGVQEYSWYMANVHFLKKQENSYLCLAQVTDITEQIHREQDLEESKRALREVIHITENDTDFLKLSPQKQRLAFQLYSNVLPMGMIGGYCEKDWPLFFVSNEIIKMLGYDSYDEFVVSVQGKVANTIYFEDLTRVIKDVKQDYYEGQEYATTYRMVRKDGSVFWVMDRGRVLETEDHRLAILSFCVDITEIMERQHELADQVDALSEQNRELLYLNNQMPSGYHRCAHTPDYDFLYISNRFLKMFGYSREEIKELFDDKFLNMVHPQDRGRMTAAVASLNETGNLMNAEYRMKAKKGYIWVIDQTSQVEYKGEVFYQGAVVDVTVQVEQRNSMRLLMQSAGEDILILTTKLGEIAELEVLTCGYVKRQGLTEEKFLQLMWRKLKEADRPDNALYEKNQQFRESLRHKENFQAMIAIDVAEEQKWLYMRSDYVESNGDEDKFLWAFSDITDKVLEELPPKRQLSGKV